MVHFTSALPAAMIGPGPPVFSHDGSKLLFGNPATNQFYIRALDDPEAMPVAGTEGAQFGSFSPDDEWIAFTAPGEIRKVPVSGGAALTLYEGNVNGGTPISWGEDDRIYYTAADGLQSIAGAGGEPETIAKEDPAAGELGFVAPQLLPGGEYVLVKALTSAGLADFRVLAISTSTGEKKTILDAAGDARFIPTGAAAGVGHLVYGRNGSLFATAFDTSTLEAGPPVPVLQGIVGTAGLVYFGVSDTGTLAYVSGEATNGLQTFSLSWVSRDGSEQAIPAPVWIYQEIRLSPDGQRIVGRVQDVSQSITFDLWVYELARQTFNKITFGAANVFPVWTTDGNRLIHTNGGLLNQTLALQSTAADSSDESIEIWKDDQGFIPWSLSPDGVLIGNQPAAPGSGAAGNQLMVLKLDPDGKSANGTLEPFLDTRFLRSNPEFSPDGKWVAYQSNQTGQNEIYVVPYPGPGGIVQISSSGGTQPRWRGDGRELFFRNGDKVMAVDIEVSGSTLRALTPHELFEKASPDYDVSSDGSRFLMLTQDTLTGADTPPAELNIILNWDEQLRQLVPLE